MVKEDEIKAGEWLQSVRNRPGMYMGHTGTWGMVNVTTLAIAEIIDITGGEPTLKVELHAGKEISLIVEARSGLQQIANILLVNQQLFKAMHLNVIKALSSRFFFTYNDTRFVFAQGLKEKEYKTSLAPGKLQIKWRFDENLIDVEEIDFLALAKPLYYLAILNPGTFLQISDNRNTRKNILSYNYPDGIQMHFKRLCDEAFDGYNTVQVKAETALARYHVLVGKAHLRRADGAQQVYVNSLVEPVAGSFLEGIKDGICEATNSGTRIGKKDRALPHFCLVGAIKIQEPEWAGSFKTELNMPVLRREIGKLIFDALKNNKAFDATAL